MMDPQDTSEVSLEHQAGSSLGFQFPILDLTLKMKNSSEAASLQALCQNQFAESSASNTMFPHHL